MLAISRAWAHLLAVYYNGYIKYSHINKHGMWEFYIIDENHNTLYQSKGIKQ